MLRDDAALKIGVTFNYKRFILNTDITEDKNDGRRRLSLRDKEADSVKEMFMDRARLHRFVLREEKCFGSTMIVSGKVTSTEPSRSSTG